MVIPNYDVEDMANAFDVISETAETRSTRAKLEQYLLSELVDNHKDHVVALLKSLPKLEFSIDIPEDSTNYLQLVASHNGAKIVVTIFESDDVTSVNVSRESEAKDEKLATPQHEWFYELWESLCFISDDKKVERLTDAEAAVFHIGLLEAEVMNGGLGQYLTNTDGAYINKTVTFLDIVGAKKTSQILNEAVKLRGKRDQFIDIWVTKKEQLEELDNKFLSSKEDLAGLVAESYLEKTW